jgi:hypothetical protein
VEVRRCLFAARWRRRCGVLYAHFWRRRRCCVIYRLFVDGGGGGDFRSTGGACVAWQSASAHRLHALATVTRGVMCDACGGGEYSAIASVHRGTRLRSGVTECAA